MNTIIIFFSVTGILCIGWGLMISSRYKKFYKNIKQGDKVYVYIDNDKYIGVITNLTNSHASLITIAGKITVSRDELYPILGINYEPLWEK
ncbi:MAG: hypothetical protein H8E34_11455 [Bacteroidetes bacterium]|nr:hypothetical protein [Bacteroidota bacterium]